MDFDFFFYFHEGEDYTNIAISSNDVGVNLSPNEGKMIADILQKITDRLENK